MKERSRLDSILAWANELATSEWLLTRCRLPNGGSVILARATLTTCLVYCGGLLGRNLLDPHLTWDFSASELRLQVLASAEWFGAIFAGVYAALYARFSSQWGYLAGLYNQIKAAEVRDPGAGARVLADWKAGFIEDAEALHLATKPLFRSVVLAWGLDPAVRSSYASHSNDSEGLDCLLERLHQGGQSRLAPRAELQDQDGPSLP